MALFEIAAGALVLKALSDSGSGSNNKAPGGATTPPPIVKGPAGQQPAPPSVADRLRDTAIATGVTLATSLALAGAKAGLTAIGTAAGAAGVTPGGAFGAAAYIAEQAALGYAITGDAGGAVAGVAFAAPAVGSGTGFVVSQGNVANVGRVLGAWVDKFLGGDGRNGTGAALQVGGFVAGLVLACWGFYAIPVVGELLAIFVGIVYGIDDAVKLAYGQRGLLNDLRRAGRQFFNTTVENGRIAIMQAAGLSSLAPADELRIRAAAAVLAIGYVREEVVERYRHWTVHAPGGPANPNDGGWAADRGYYLLQANANLLYGYVTALAAADANITTHEDLFNASWAAYLAPSQAEIAKIASVDHLNLDQRGVGCQNVAHYLTAMGQMWGVGAGATGNALFWRDVELTFTGDISAQNGNLYSDIGGGTYPGIICDWQASSAQNKPVLIVEMNDPVFFASFKAATGPWR